MKRCLANLIVVALCWPLLAVGIPAVTGPAIPACCRRDGAHHCMMMRQQGEGFQALTQCPYRRAELLAPVNATPAEQHHVDSGLFTTAFLAAPPVASLPGGAQVQRPGRAPPR